MNYMALAKAVGSVIIIACGMILFLFALMSAPSLYSDIVVAIVVVAFFVSVVYVFYTIFKDIS